MKRKKMCQHFKSLKWKWAPNEMEIFNQWHNKIGNKERKIEKFSIGLWHRAYCTLNTYMGILFKKKRKKKQITK